MKGYTNEEIEILKSNPNVVTVKYGRQVEYKEEFKKWAVNMSYNHPELSACQIFKMAGFDMDIINSDRARGRINYWKKSYLKKVKGTISLADSYKIDLDNNDKLKKMYAQFSKLVELLERTNKIDRFK